MNRRLFVRAAVAAVAAIAAGAGTAPSAWAQVVTVNGEVVKLDKPAGRVTIKHGEIKGLDMPPMTLNWRVVPPRLLDDIAVGDRVRFVPARLDGQYTITSLNKAPQ
jgi:Cu/Ag efflux protein CusF